MNPVSLVGAILFTAVATTAVAQTPAPPQLTPAEQKIAANAAGVGDLLVAPTRIVFAGRTRTAELALINIGSDPASFRISTSRMSMKPTGELVEVEQPTAEGELFGDQLIRFSPRQVTLEPHVAQTVRLQLRLPADLATGEYRINLLFRGVPKVTQDAAATDPAPDGGFQIRLTPVYGVSIPIIIRHGQTSARAGIAEPQIIKPADPAAQSALRMKLTRSGNRSVYGNITVRFTPRGGRETVVGVINGIAVYTPLAWRMAEIPLRPAEGVVLGRGRLRVTYADAEQNVGDVLAETEIDLP